MYKKSEKGFTLVELILFILLLALLLAVAIPTIFAVRRKIRAGREALESVELIVTPAGVATAPATSLPSSTPTLPLSISLTSATPDPVFFGPCTGSEPTVIEFVVETSGDTTALNQLVIWYTYFNSDGSPVMGDAIPMQVSSGETYQASLDISSYAAAALGTEAGTLQFFAQAQDGSGGMLAQSDGSQITIQYCEPPGVTGIPPVKPPTLTPQPPPGPVDQDDDGYDRSSDCDDGNGKVHPGAQENDNGIDDNCDGKIDEGFDNDGDGYTPVFGADCNDEDPSINPGAPETPDDKIDSNCNGDDDSFIPNLLPEVALPLMPERISAKSKLIALV